MGLRPGWSTRQVQGQLGLSHSETLFPSRFKALCRGRGGKTGRARGLMHGELKAAMSGCTRSVQAEARWFSSTEKGG